MARWMIQNVYLLHHNFHDCIDWVDNYSIFAYLIPSQGSTIKKHLLISWFKDLLTTSDGLPLWETDKFKYVSFLICQFLALIEFFHFFKDTKIFYISRISCLKLWFALWKYFCYLSFNYLFFMWCKADIFFQFVTIHGHLFTFCG